MARSDVLTGERLTRVAVGCEGQRWSMTDAIRSATFRRAAAGGHRHSPRLGPQRTVRRLPGTPSGPWRRARLRPPPGAAARFGGEGADRSRRPGPDRTSVLDPGCPVELHPARRTPGQSGVSLFAHPTTVAVRDLVTLSLTVSDNAATDALVNLVSPPRSPSSWPPGVIAAWWCVTGSRSCTARWRPAQHDLGVPDGARHPRHHAGGGHPIEQLDPARANAGDVADLPICRPTCGPIGSPTPGDRRAALGAGRFSSPGIDLRESWSAI